MYCKDKFYIETVKLKRWQYPVIIWCVVFSVFQLNAQDIEKGRKITTVVIDAGHGGRDPGALGKHAREKDITLKVALKVGRYIKANLSDVKVIYTRTSDKFIPLKRRGEIANKNNADLFISIHCNSNPSKSLYGTETYVLGSDDKRRNRNMQVAMLENAAILLEKDAQNTYDGFDPNAPESYIIFSLKQDDYKQNQSILLAQKIQSQFKNRAGRKDRGVHQAGFLVLAGTYMPSALVELGYLSNTIEEKYLMSDKGQSYLASAIYRAVKAYKREYELENNANIVDDKKISKPGVLKKETKTKSAVRHDGTEYRVQFYTSAKKIPVTHQKFASLPEVDVYYHNGLYKYTSGHFATISQAVQQQTLLRKKGYKDAFIIKMKSGKRVY